MNKCCKNETEMKSTHCDSDKGVNERISYKTRNRELILEYLKDNFETAVTVNDISDFMEQKNCQVNVTTIYRYLDRLVNDGVLVKYAQGAGDKATFQMAKESHSCNSHLHIQCMKCNRVVHLDCEFMKEVESHFLEHHGFTLVPEGTILHGVCSDCRKGV